MDKKLDGNYTRMLRAILNKSWRPHPTKQQLYAHLPPIMKPDMQDAAGGVGMNSLATNSCGPHHTNEERQDNQLGPIYNSSVLIQDVALKTNRE